MKIKALEIKNFKRFTHLKIQDIPESSKLVVLIGSNGSGKSSVFDVFGLANNVIVDDLNFKDKEIQDYYKKDVKNPVSIKIEFNDKQQFNFQINKKTSAIFELLPQQTFYGRTSFRQIPRLTRTALGQGGQISFEKDTDRPKFFIDRDNRFENDIEKITETILKDFFLKTGVNIIERFIEPINKALNNIFGNQNGTKLELLEIIPPIEGKVAQITFRKGVSLFHYNYLSAGEKEVFNLLINLLSRATLYQDTIYYLDEIDLHLNTKLQFNLLKEITENWMPDNCQLWTATHSLGFIEYAKQSEQAAIIDFDDLDFDEMHILTPESKDNPDIYEIAVGKDILPSLFQQMNVFFVENTDRSLYASVNIPKTVFISDNNRNSVYHKVKSTQINGIVDRDFLTDDDIEQIKKEYPQLFILNYYSLENFLYHPDNLEEYYCNKSGFFDKGKYIAALIQAKNDVKNQIILKVASVRSGYPYFSEPHFNGKPFQNRFKNAQENFDQTAIIQSYLDSNELAMFYKSLPMKDYCKQIPERQNISKTDLSKTTWFKNKISDLLAKT